MIRIPHASDTKVSFVAPGAILSVTPTSSSSNYSLRSIVRLTNNQVIESSADAADIAAQVEKMTAHRNIETQEYARKVLARYANNERVSDLYDEEEAFGNALHTLIGPGFEYTDWAHKTVGEILKQFSKEKS